MIEHITALLKELAICVIVLVIIAGIAAASGALCLLFWLVTSAVRGESFPAFLKNKSENRLVEVIATIFQLTYPFLLSEFSDKQKRRSDQIAHAFLSAVSAGG